jgi:hypothetical protein
MATAPWRCSQCGTINEPVANSCRTCGKWPSLFDLEDSVVDEGFTHERTGEDELYDEAEPVSAPEPELDLPEPVTVEVEAYEPTEQAGMPSEKPKRGRFEPPPTDPVGDGEGSTPRWISWLIPLAVVAYFVISTILNNR